MPRMSPNMVRVNLYITERQNKLLQALAKKRGTTFSEMMRTMLDRALTGQRMPKE